MQVINTCDRDISCWSCHRHHCGKRNSCKQWPHTYLASAWMSERFFIYLYFFFSVWPFSTIETFLSLLFVGRMPGIGIELDDQTMIISISLFNTQKGHPLSIYLVRMCITFGTTAIFDSLFVSEEKKKTETFLLTFNWDACSVNNNAIDDSAIVVCFCMMRKPHSRRYDTHITHARRACGECMWTNSGGEKKREKRKKEHVKTWIQCIKWNICVYSIGRVWSFPFALCAVWCMCVKITMQASLCLWLATNVNVFL